MTTNERFFQETPKSHINTSYKEVSDMIDKPTTEDKIRYLSLKTKLIAASPQEDKNFFFEYLVASFHLSDEEAFSSMTSTMKFNNRKKNRKYYESRGIALPPRARSNSMKS
jgi:hypothetical protein